MMQGDVEPVLLVSRGTIGEKESVERRGLLHTLSPHYLMLSPHHVAWRRTAVLYKALWADGERQVGAGLYRAPETVRGGRQPGKSGGRD